MREIARRWTSTSDLQFSMLSVSSCLSPNQVIVRVSQLCWLEAFEVQRLTYVITVAIW
jgi:hypothetical protein